jgi:uncharacterized membrane-anchored protein YitT (DUF2179 family)
MTKRKKIGKMIQKYLLIFIGSILAAVGLEIFLIPNNIIDGGIIGISIIASHLSKLPLGMFTFVLNIPFLFFGYKQIGKTFVVSSLFATASLSFWISILHPIPGLTNDVLLATVFGGIIEGIGVGLIIRNGGSLDGTEIVAIVLNKRTVFSVGQMVMFFNLFILSSAGLFFGWDRAMYSLIAYFIAYKLIDIVVEGFDEVKAAMIISDNGEEIAEAIMARLGRGVTFLEGKGGFSKNKKTILYAVVTRLEIAKLKSIIYDKDEDAFVTIQDVSDIMGGKHKKQQIH